MDLCCKGVSVMNNYIVAGNGARNNYGRLVEVAVLEDRLLLLCSHLRDRLLCLQDLRGQNIVVRRLHLKRAANNTQGILGANHLLHEHTRHRRAYVRAKVLDATQTADGSNVFVANKTLACRVRNKSIGKLYIFRYAFLYIV